MLFESFCSVSKRQTSGKFGRVVIYYPRIPIDDISCFHLKEEKSTGTRVCGYLKKKKKKKP